MAMRTADPDPESSQMYIDAELVEKTSPGLHKWLYGKVAALPGINLKSSVLDMGCGSGAWLKRLSAAGFSSLVGMDNRDEFKAGAYARFVCRDLQGESPRDLQRRFDLITAIEVVEHLSNPEILFAKAAEWLSDSGWLLVTTPNLQSLRNRLRFLVTGKLIGFDESADPTHLHPLISYTYERLIIQRHGLAIRSVATYPERVSEASRPIVRLGLRTLSRIIGNPLPGDSLCLFIQRVR
jgi:2-polyprenyl-3-methyl-5-hydroxy-6-metoxy-1,4-benzoquinol methylase